MPMPLVEPMPSLPLELRFGAPLLAQEASYLAASARMVSLSISCMARDIDTVFIYSIWVRRSYQGFVVLHPFGAHETLSRHAASEAASRTRSSSCNDRIRTAS